MIPRARAAVRWLAWIGGIALVVLLVSGVYVTFRYRPDADGRDLGMVRLHKWSSFVFGLASLGVMLVSVASLARRGLRVFSAIGVYLVAQIVCIATGRRLAWDQVGLFAVTQGHDVRGMFFVPHAARFVRVNGHEYSWMNHRNLFWMHTVGLPLVMAAAFTWGLLWARRLRRQPDMKSSAETPAAIRR